MFVVCFTGLVLVSPIHSWGTINLDKDGSFKLLHRPCGYCCLKSKADSNIFFQFFDHVGVSCSVAHRAPSEV